MTGAHTTEAIAILDQYHSLFIEVVQKCEDSLVKVLYQPAAPGGA